MPVIPTTWETKIGTLFKASPGKKLARCSSQQISQAWWYTPVIPTIWEVLGENVKDPI
jgi:hypothetical protein